MRTRAGLASAVMALTVGFLVVRPLAAQPQIPATFYGSASIDGEAPPPETDVRALIDGVDCTQVGDTRRFTIENGVGMYVVNVVHETQQPGCGVDGKVVRFTIGGRLANEEGIWRRGPQRLDLNAGSGEPVPLPTATPTPEGQTRTAVSEPDSGGSPVDRPTGPIPTDDIALTPGPARSPTRTVAPPASGDPYEGDGGSGGLWVGLAVGLGALGVGGGLLGYALSRRRSFRRPA